MVRAGAVGTHLPTSGLDIFGDLRKMNKRQVTEGRVRGAPGVGHPRQGSRKDSAPRHSRQAFRGPGFKPAWTRV